ncbi:MAG: nucleotidyltransferase domain-containing protein [Chloroflexota bacterium]
MRQRRSEQKIPMQAVESLRNALGERLIAVVLFGSQARGDVHEASDWDLLVIAEGLPGKSFERHLFLKRLLPPSCRGGISLIAKTPQEFQSRLPSLFLDMALDGRILYDPQGYGAAKMAALRRLIRRSGLYRERTQAGDVWRWKKTPAQPWRLEWSE